MTRLAIVNNNAIGGIVVGAFNIADFILYAFNPTENTSCGLGCVFVKVSTSYRLGGSTNL